MFGRLGEPSICRGIQKEWAVIAVDVNSVVRGLIDCGRSNIQCRNPRGTYP